jgi:hypothetical protein
LPSLTSILDYRKRVALEVSGDTLPCFFISDMVSTDCSDQLMWETAKQPLTARSIGALRKRLENLAIDTITLRHDSAYDEMIGQPLRSSNTLDVRLTTGD